MARAVSFFVCASKNLGSHYTAGEAMHAVGPSAMSFALHEHIDIPDGSLVRRIALYEGDLTAIPKEHSPDILVISAFPNDYGPSDRSLIGDLNKAGLSIRQLAAHKAHDLRDTAAFWLSNPIKGDSAQLNIKRIACFEPMVLGSPPTVVADLFRGLFPFLDDRKSQIVAMPIMASGDQGYPKEIMLRSILRAASHWFARGLGNKHAERTLLFPVYWRSSQKEFPLWLRTLNYDDCRESDYKKLTRAVAEFAMPTFIRAV